VPEGLIQPYDMFRSRRYYSEFFYRLLRFIGLYFNYINYGTGGCDYILVSGRRAFELLKKIGVPENKMTIVGHQKYDDFINNLPNNKPCRKGQKVYLFAVSKRIFQDDAEIRILQKVIDAITNLNLDLIVKIHPRTPEGPADLKKRIGLKSVSSCKIIKEGYDTLEILSEVDAIITIPSAIILEALILDKECLIISYLEGESFSDYILYDALYFINSDQDISKVIKISSTTKKKKKNKIHLLENELYRLDGKASFRTAIFIKNLIRDTTNLN
jgi:hypothetical protein